MRSKSLNFQFLLVIQYLVVKGTLAKILDLVQHRIYIIMQKIMHYNLYYRFIQIYLFELMYNIAMNFLYNYILRCIQNHYRKQLREKNEFERDFVIILI